MTKDVHQQCVGAAAGIKFTKPAIVLDVMQSVRDRQHLCQTLAPNRSAHDRAIASRMKVSMRGLIRGREEDHAARFIMAAPELNTILLRIVHSARRELVAKLGCVRGHDYKCDAIVRRPLGHSTVLELEFLTPNRNLWCFIAQRKADPLDRKITERIQMDFPRGRRDDSVSDSHQ